MKWRIILAVVLLGTLTQALPVKEKKEEKEEEEHKGDGEQGSEDWELNLEYGRYLKEVVQALESDPSFRKKLETAEVDDIKSGKIARELHFVDHNVRTKLDELKRRELERLRHLAIKEHEKLTGVDRNLLKIPVHIDHRNPTRFEVEDLKRLIIKTTEDLEKVDEQRRTEFKKYEMEKEFERQMELAKMDEEHRKQAEAKHNEEVEKHSKHTKLHHPGSKPQLEEVWEEQDHMKPEDFNPKTFFHLHDLDGNGYWDEMEVKALFKKELDKMYDPNAPEDDINERYEEMERMREHVFKESDTDKDNLISYKEFVDQTRRAEFEQDKGWQGLDEQEIYSQQEYEEFERQRQEEIRHLVESGAIPAQPESGQHVQGDVAHVQSAPGQGQAAQSQPAQGQVAQGQVLQGQLAQGQAAQGQPAQGQAPQGQPGQGQVPQGQLVQGQVAQGQLQGQVVQGQPPQGQIVEGQHPELQVPVLGHIPQPPQPVAGNNVVGQPTTSH
ncbi:nucleobindin-2 isoform X2 [Panulirus ornatus]|uniref:nucleobindin-2 isoform X2 n=1 Tax=Panulirus ornatus TaxID=150431 RepID=UPI003A8B516F